MDTLADASNIRCRRCCCHCASRRSSPDCGAALERSSCTAPPVSCPAEACIALRSAARPGSPSRRLIFHACQMQHSHSAADRRHREDDAGRQTGGGGEPATADDCAVHRVVQVGRRQREDAQKGPLSSPCTLHGEHSTFTHPVMRDASC